MHMNSLIEIKDVCKSFGNNDARIEALKSVCLTIAEGEMVAVMGKSGSGKSTLLNILGGMMSFDDGEYIYKGKKVNSRKQGELTKFRRHEIGFVMQYFALVGDLNVFQNVALPLKYQGYSRKKINTMVMEALKELEIEDKVKAYPDELSGGQQQRVAIARAIVKHPSVILADEPTGALDEATGDTVQNIFNELNKKGITVIIVTHDSRVAGRCGRIIHLKDGRVTDAGDAAAVAEDGGIAAIQNGGLYEDCR